jgi:hypothetical protein
MALPHEQGVRPEWGKSFINPKIYQKIFRFQNKKLYWWRAPTWYHTSNGKEQSGGEKNAAPRGLLFHPLGGAQKFLHCGISQRNQGRAGFDGLYVQN